MFLRFPTKTNPGGFRQLVEAESGSHGLLCIFQGRELSHFFDPMQCHTTKFIHCFKASTFILSQVAVMLAMLLLFLLEVKPVMQLLQTPIKCPQKDFKLILVSISCFDVISSSGKPELVEVEGEED